MPGPPIDVIADFNFNDGSVEAAPIKLTVPLLSIPPVNPSAFVFTVPALLLIADPIKEVEAVFVIVAEAALLFIAPPLTVPVFTKAPVFSIVVSKVFVPSRFKLPAFLTLASPAAVPLLVNVTSVRFTVPPFVLSIAVPKSSIVAPLIDNV